ncbi:hypothetical protein C0993_011746 [Termitomyces sp. T159_Od127]|nr:hypothetical protein C0993_011746 [Termitomyces sp. T159_Od127]
MFVLLQFRDVQDDAKSILPLPLPRRNRRVRLRLLPAIVLCVIVLVCLRFATWPLFAHPVEPLKILSISEDLLSTAPPRILLVSAFFPLTDAKHTHDEYISWLTNFLGPDGVQSDVYFYTIPELASLVSSLNLYPSTPAAANRNLTINTTYTSPFSIPPLAPYTSKYHAMHAWDRERAIHNPELYAVWNAKPWLLDHALRALSHFEYDYAFWVDAGSFRDPHPFRSWPDPRRVEQVFANSNKDKVLIPLYGVPGIKEYSWRFEMGPVDMDLSEGSFFGSTPRGISWYSKTFYQTHDWYINTSPPHGRFLQWLSSLLSTNHTPFHFVGKDQTLINAMLFRYPDKFLGVLVPSRAGLLPPPPSPLRTTSEEPPIPIHISTFSSLLTRITHALPFLRTKPCGDWYFYEWFLASDRERAWAQESGWTRCPREHAQGKGRELLVDVEGMLKGLFGARWVEGRKAGGA